MTETPERLRMAAIPVQVPMEVPGQGQGETAPSALAPGTQEVTEGAVGEQGEGATEDRGIIREPRGSGVEPREEGEEVRTDRVEELHLAGTKSTTTASRTLRRRHRQERSFRHQELCQETTTITGLAATTAVTPVDSVQV